MTAIKIRTRDNNSIISSNRYEIKIDFHNRINETGKLIASTQQFAIQIGPDEQL
jgi:hypothetical protein